MSGALHAQEFPVRPVRIVTSGSGGSADLVARLIAQGLTPNLGEQVNAIKAEMATLGPVIKAAGIREE